MVVSLTGIKYRLGTGILADARGTDLGKGYMEIHTVYTYKNSSR